MFGRELSFGDRFLRAFLPLLTVGISGGPCSSGVISGVLRVDSSGEETICSISGGDCLEDPPCLRDFWVLCTATEKDFLVGFRVLAWWILFVREKMWL